MSPAQILTKISPLPLEGKNNSALLYAMMISPLHTHSVFICIMLLLFPAVHRISPLSCDITHIDTPHCACNFSPFEYPFRLFCSRSMFNPCVDLFFPNRAI